MASLVVGAAEYFERQQWKELRTTLRTVDAEVIGCDAATLVLPQLRYTAEGTTYQHYPRYAPDDICDKKPRQVTYVAGHPNSWALAPASPLPPFEDEIGAYWIVSGPLLLGLAAIYWVFLWFADRRAGREARLVKEGGLIGAELLSAKYYPGSPKGGSPQCGGQVSDDPADRQAPWTASNPSRCSTSIAGPCRRPAASCWSCGSTTRCSSCCRPCEVSVRSSHPRLD